MAGSFTSPSGSPAKSKSGKGGLDQAKARQKAKPEYPITDDFAAHCLPDFKTRRAHTNAKSGWNTTPARPPAGRMVERPTEPAGGWRASRAKGIQDRQKSK